MSVKKKSSHTPGLSISPRSKRSTSAYRKHNHWNIIHGVLLVSAIAFVVLLISQINKTTEMRSKAAPLIASTIKSWDFNKSAEGWTGQSVNLKTNNGLLIATVIPGRLSNITSPSYNISFNESQITIPAGLTNFKIRTAVEKAYQINDFYLAPRKSITPTPTPTPAPINYSFKLELISKNKTVNTRNFTVSSSSLTEYTVNLSAAKEAMHFDTIKIIFPPVGANQRIVYDYIRIENIPMPTKTPSIYPTKSISIHPTYITSTPTFTMPPICTRVCPVGQKLIPPCDCLPITCTSRPDCLDSNPPCAVRMLPGSELCTPTPTPPRLGCVNQCSVCPAGSTGCTPICTLSCPATTTPTPTVTGCQRVCKASCSQSYCPDICTTVCDQ